ncbi:TRAP dicarboxylate transporter, DctM subunit [Planococcus donghaensis MPA1U2]|uniref:TRAP dicarboxylate transporter, DctM subunit n=1 Tax=Planococcus donghaensis MPA1U2 TaxID=933115 RepID=E7RG62_9BACL|nr:TRAP transporter large permease [Planococcus donghaensis]EGA90009.1 TRAP dicarboxylate transporter, DctM subunit [Planococcus donghaensis MPA1U2]
MAIATLLILFLVLLVVGVPVALAMGLTSIVVAFLLDIPLSMLAQRMVAGINSFPLLAIPFFILAGEIMNTGGISQKLIKLSDSVVGRFRGGLGMVNVSSSMLFGGISGSALADASSSGSLMIPMMKKKGYDADYSVAVTVTSSTQGIVIPPSHNMIIYALAAGGGISISSLFLAGIIPGILLGLGLMVTAYLIAVKRNYPSEKPSSIKEIGKAIRLSFPGLMTGVIIIGGIMTGIFTVTESAAIAVVYAFLLSFVFNRDVSIRLIVPVLKRTFKTLALVLFLIATSSGFAWLLALLRVPTLISENLLGLTNSPILITLILIFILIFLGLLLDVAPIILITTPILLPIATSIGMDPVHYGIMMMICMAIGLVTPPVGGALFIGSAIAKIPMESVVKALLPFYISMIIVLLLVAFVPQITLLIPNFFD